METITIEALSVAAFSAALTALPHETRATVTATEHGAPWAVVDISPMTDSARAVFPNYPKPGGGFRGDTAKRGQSGVILWSHKPHEHELRTVVARAMRMFRSQ